MPKSRSAYDLIQRKGRRFHHPAFSLITLPSRVALQPRIVVSHKIDKRSVVRNKVKRRIKQILRSNQELYLGRGVIIITKKDILNISFQDLAASLIRSLKAHP